MIKRVSFVLVFFIALSLVSAQWVESENFVEVSSAQVGSESSGCYVACISGMLASVNHPLIGNNSQPIIASMNRTLVATGATFPYTPSVVIHSVVKFILETII